MRTVGDWTKVGDTLYGLKRYEEALAAFERAIRLDPTSYNYGFFKLTTRARKDQAVSVIVTAGVCKPSVARSEADKHFFLPRLASSQTRTLWRCDKPCMTFN